MLVPSALRGSLLLAILALAALVAPTFARAQEASPSDQLANEPIGPLDLAPPPLGGPAPPKEEPKEPPEEVLPIERLPRPYDWYDTYYWMPPDIWSGSFELGINGSAGNAEAFSMRVGGNVKRKTDWDQFEWKITRAQTQSNGVTTQNNAIMNMKEEIFLQDSKWSVFGTTYLEYDEFKAFDLRLALNGGLGYQFLKLDSVKFKGRFGAGTSHEFGSAMREWVPEGLFGGDLEVQISARQKLTATSDYFPDWGNFTKYRLVTNVGWEWLLDEATNMHLKVLVIDRYDSTPQGRQPNDIDYSILLLWKI